jgi:glutamyl-tRNA reductase
MSSEVVLVGLSHRRAPVEVRERVALTEDQAGALARRLAGEKDEAVCLSTCNRTEIYGAFGDGDTGAQGALRALVDVSGMDADELSGLVYRLHGEDVALHLFRVAAGLDSLVPARGRSSDRCARHSSWARRA